MWKRRLWHAMSRDLLPIPRIWSQITAQVKPVKLLRNWNACGNNEKVPPMQMIRLQTNWSRFHPKRPQLNSHRCNSVQYGVFSCSWNFSSLNKALLKQSFHVGLHKEEVRKYPIWILCAGCIFLPCKYLAFLTWRGCRQCSPLDWTLSCAAAWTLPASLVAMHW